MIRRTLITLALAGGALWSQPPGPPPPHMMFKALGLTAAQDQAVKAILDKHRPAESTLRQAARDKDEALRAAMDDPAATEAQLRALHAALSEARLQELLDHRSLALEINALLTPDQLAKAKAMREHPRGMEPPPED